ncbi:MAG: tetratricopeptide repeat protein [Anaerolineaceae bacterium]|nr:tetratricopeptide repeat protein [Anaerolineaceae bacterium]
MEIRLKWAAILLLALFLAGWGRGQGDETALFAQANAAYESGNYTQAIDRYLTLENLHVVDARLYYNLGNAYYQTGDLGRALLYYLRAQTLAPRDSDLMANMALVRTERRDIEGDESGILEGLAALTTGLLRTVELAALDGLLWVLWCAGMVVYILRSRWRETLRGPLLVVGVVVVFGLLLLVSRVYIQDNRPTAVVVTPNSQVMSGPGMDYLPLYPLYAAAEIRLVESRAGWVRFSLPDGRQGWLPESAIVSVESP